MKDKGCCFLSQVDDVKNQMNEDLLILAMTYKSKFYSIKKDNILPALVILLNRNIPILSTLTIGNKLVEFNTENKDEVLDIDKIKAGTEFNHTVCIVGYRKEANEKYTFKILNSWGCSWGYLGYAWITGNAIQRAGKEFYCLEGDEK